MEGKRGTGTGDGNEGRDGTEWEERNKSDLFRCSPALFRRHLLRGALNLRYFNFR